jgi:hypothetical protein
MHATPANVAISTVAIDLAKDVLRRAGSWNVVG